MSLKKQYLKSKPICKVTFKLKASEANNADTAKLLGDFNAWDIQAEPMKKLKNGDILNIDITVIKDGYHGDTSKMFIVGKGSTLSSRLCDVTRQSMIEGIKVIKPGCCIGDIGAAIQEYAESNNYSVVREYCGHGIGKKFHENPQILHYGKKNTGLKLQAGMTFTVEPMINVGSHRTKVLNDGWTVVTQDHELSAQYEHTVLVTDQGFDILTIRPDEDINEYK